LAMDSKKTNYS